MNKVEEIVIIAPCYNEQGGIISFLQSVEQVCSGLNYYFTVIIVDDGSTDQTLQILKDFNFNVAHVSLTVLQLNFNSGHQEAIFQGLMYAKAIDSDRFIVMDSDGQDDVSLIPEMLESQNFDVVHVIRKKRKESFLFRMCYILYKTLFKLITGKSIQFGNYCLITKKVLTHTTTKGFIHFPAFLSTFTQKKQYLYVDRKKRIFGKSKMNYLNLFNHGIKSLIQYAERLLVICLWIFILLTITLVLFAGYVFYKKFFTDRAILGWASTIIISLFNSVLISLSTFVIGTQLLKNSYSNTMNFNASVIKKNGKPTKTSSNE